MTGDENNAEAVMGEPDDFQALQAVFGQPSQGAWGSAVFVSRIEGRDDLEARALETYRTFVGDAWERFGADAWMSGWRLEHERSGGGDTVAALEGSGSVAVRSAADILVNAGPAPADEARALIKRAFDAPDTDIVRIYEVGDGGAYSGLLIGARRASGDAAFLVFIMD